MNPGDVLTSESGRELQLTDAIGVGGQGKTYWAKEAHKRAIGVVKEFKPEYCDRDTETRIRYLLDLDLAKHCVVFVPPIDLVKNGSLAHYAPKAPGVSLEDCLREGSFFLPDAVVMLRSLNHAMKVLHGAGIAHGDLQSENLLAEQRDDVWRISLIDFDNFAAAGAPRPRMIGQNLYMAPELYPDKSGKTRLTPNRETDCFSLGVLFHEILLLRHPAAGLDRNPDLYFAAMSSGKWLQDPAGGNSDAEKLGGYPTRVLTPDIMRMFRRSFSMDPGTRPTPEEWEPVLEHAQDSLYSCPHCNNSGMLDTSKTACPVCLQPFPPLVLVFPDDKRIVIDRGSVVIGRSDFRNAPKVSYRHAILRRVGPEVRMEPCGRNATERWSGSRWVPLKNGEHALIQQGDRLRMADQEIRVEKLVTGGK